MNEKSIWIPVGALGDAFSVDNNALPIVSDLNGKTLNLHFENGWAIEHIFMDGGRLNWRGIAGDVQGEEGRETYTVTHPRPGIYFVDFIKSGERATSVSMIFDLNRQVFTALISQLPTAEQANESFLKKIAANKALTSVSAYFLSGAIDQPFTANTPRHTLTDELLGKRIHYTYSPTEKYEHTYQNQSFYAWQCLSGSEQGLADADLCHYYKIDDQLYWFVWREKIVPTLGVVMIDLLNLKTTGKIFGYAANDFGDTTNFAVGAHAKVVSDLRSST